MRKVVENNRDRAPKEGRKKKKGIGRIILTVFLVLVLGMVWLFGCSDSDESEQTGTSSAEGSASAAAETKGSATADAASFDNYYFISQLDSDMMDNFLALYNAVSNFEEETVFPHPVAEENEKDVYMLLLALVYECPEQFQWDSGDVEFFRYKEAEDEIAGCDFTYRMDKTSYDAYMNQCQGILSTLQKQTSGMSDYEKELYVYNYLADSTVYDDSTEFCDSVYGVLIEGRAKCVGISAAFQYICDGLDLPCVSLFCYADEENFGDGHAWNAVNIDGEWYDVDLTAEVPREDAEADTCWYYGALNVPRTWITDAHDPVSTYYTDYFDLPESVSFDADYHVVNDEFVAEGGDYATAYRDGITKAFDNGSDSVSLQFESDEDYNAFLEAEDDISTDWLNHYSSDTVTGLGGSLYHQDAYRTIVFVPEFKQE